MFCYSVKLSDTVESINCLSRKNVSLVCFLCNSLGIIAKLNSQIYESKKSIIHNSFRALSVLYIRFQNRVHGGITYNSRIQFFVKTTCYFATCSSCNINDLVLATYLILSLDIYLYRTGCSFSSALVLVHCRTISLSLCLYQFAMNVVCNTCIQMNIIII